MSKGCLYALWSAYLFCVWVYTLCTSMLSFMQTHTHIHAYAFSCICSLQLTAYTGACTASPSVSYGACSPLVRFTTTFNTTMPTSSVVITCQVRFCLCVLEMYIFFRVCAGSFVCVSVRDWALIIFYVCAIVLLICFMCVCRFNICCIVEERCITLSNRNYILFFWWVSG